MAYENDVLTRNEDSELAVRVVTATEGTNNSSYDDVFTRDSNGKLAVRVVGAGGGDSHNLGFYATQAALEEAYPTAEAGDYAIVGETDTVWVWDTDNSEWIDTGTKGLVQSVNGQTGTVVLTADDVGAIQKRAYLYTPESSEVGKIVQYVGTDGMGGEYTTGYFYKAVADTSGNLMDGQIMIADDGYQTYPEDLKPVVTIDINQFNSYATTNSYDTLSSPEIGVLVALDVENDDVGVMITYNNYDSQFRITPNPATKAGAEAALALCGITWDLTDYDFETQPVQMFNDGLIPTDAGAYWEQIDVQPAPDPLPSQTGHSGEFLTTNGTTASWGTTVEDNTLIIKNSQTSMYGGYPNQITFYSKYNGSDGTGASIQSGNNGSLVLSASSISTTGAIYPSGSVNLGLDTQSGGWNTVYARNLGNRSSSYVIQIPEATAGVLAVQVSTMPTADSTRVGQIYQYIGATDANYTNGYFYKCVSDGGNPATYSWTEVSVGGGNVNSVNNQTGNVVLDAEDVGAIPQLSTMPTASAANVGNIVQFKGTTTETYTNGYFYENQPEYNNPSATISQTVGSGLSNLAVDVDTFQTQINETGNYNFTANVVDTEISYENINDWEIQLTNPAGILEAFAQSGQPITGFYDGWINYFSDTGEFVCVITPIQGEPNYQIVINDFVNVITQGTTTEVATITNITFASQSWQYNNQDVNLNTYGITYSGSEVDGDVLTVNYVAAGIVGYNWEQKNIQPASAGGGIDWKTSIDLLENETYYPIFTIPGGLEDGVYEFYYQIKLANPNLTYPQCFVTYKITFNLVNGDTVRANVSYVIDGDFYTAYQKIESNSFGSSWYWVNNDIKMMLSIDKFTTNFRNYGISTEIEDCYKISAIKNVETGEEYIATGEIGQQPSADSTIGVVYQFCNLQEDPNIPTLYYSTDFYFANHKYISLERRLPKRTEPTTGTSKLYVSLFAAGRGAFSATVDLRAGEYVATIHNASGVFENTTFLKDESDKIWIQINAPVGETGNFYGQVSGISGSSFYVYGYENVDYQLSPMNINEVGGNITETNFGKILQYVGATDANYTNGYFYKATGTPVVVPEEFDATNIQISGVEVNDVVININATNLVSALETYTGWSEETIKYNLTQFTNWVVYYDWDTDAVLGVYWSAWGDINDSADVLSCFTVTTTGSYSGQTPIVFMGLFEDEHVEIQSQSWQRVDVQPSSGGSPTTSTATLAVNDWSNNSQTVNVSGVTASNLVQVAPAPSSNSDYVSGGVLCTAQGSGTLTFTCTTTPTNAITVNVVIFG